MPVPLLGAEHDELRSSSAPVGKHGLTLRKYCLAYVHENKVESAAQFPTQKASLRSISRSQRKEAPLGCPEIL